MVTENCGAISIDPGSRPSSAARVLESADALLELRPGPPAGEPAGAEARGALHGLQVVAADPQRERVLPGLWKHLDVAAGVVAPLVGDVRFAEQPEHQIDALVEHVAAAGGGLQARRPGEELLAIGADAQAQDQPSAGQLIDGGRLLGEPERIAHRQHGDGRADLEGLVAAAQNDSTVISS